MSRNFSLIFLFISSLIFSVVLNATTIFFGYDWNEYYGSLSISAVFLFFSAHLFNKTHELNTTKTIALQKTLFIWLTISVMLLTIGALTKTNIYISRFSFFFTVFIGLTIDSLFVYVLYLLKTTLKKPSLVIFTDNQLKGNTKKNLLRHFEINGIRPISDFLELDDYNDDCSFLILDELTNKNLQNYQKISLNLANRVIFMPHEDLGLNHIEKNFYGNFVLFLNDCEINNTYFGRLAKRFIDIILSSIALIFLLPLFIIVSVVIKSTSKGPAIYVQKRNGMNGKIFNMYKFRSMRIHDEKKYIQTQINDKRVTQVGKLLRKLSIDELPQLANVLKGDMSLVGPRPHAEEINRKYRKQIVNFMSRHTIKPGITGLAQINGYRGGDDLESMKKRTEYDLSYINNWSIIQDIKIILLTIPSLLNKNIY